MDSSDGQELAQGNAHVHGQEEEELIEVEESDEIKQEECKPECRDSIQEQDPDPALSSDYLKSGDGTDHAECSRRDPVEVIAQGLGAIFTPVMKKFDSRVEGAISSQETLETKIDRLTRVLDTLLEDTPMPLVAQHAARLSGIHKRLLSLSSSLHIIRLRTKNMEALLLHTRTIRMNSRNKDEMQQSLPITEKASSSSK